MDAEQKWQAISRDVENLCFAMAEKTREITRNVTDLGMLKRQLERTRVQEMDAWEAYQQSLQERGL